MKDNLNIEELFQDKFSSFEGEVSPDAWANIQQGMNAGAAGTSAATGMSLLMKGVITGGIVAATVTGIYLFSDSAEQEVATDNNLVVNDQIDNGSNNILVDQTVQNENLPDNTVNGLDVSEENLTNDLNDQVENLEDRVTGPENNGAFVSNDEGTESNESSDEIPNDNVDNGDSDTGNSGETGDQVNSDPIDEPAPAISNGPIPEKSISSNLIVEAGDEFAPTTYAFHANSENANSVEWLFEDGTILNGDDVEYTFEKPGKYQVEMLIHGDGQLDSEMIEIVIKSRTSINTLPNIITPNGDRKNDFFAISSTDIETFYIKITDLKGNVLFEDTDVNFRWYGTNLGGEQLPAGQYIYEFFAKGIDGTEIRKANQIEIRMGE